MIVGEVKEGPARFNTAARDPVVLEVALTRFGCCPRDEVRALTKQLLLHGHALTPAGHAVRMVAFGGSAESPGGMPWVCIPMRHVVEHLQQHLRQHWNVLRHAQVREPVFGVLALLEKWHLDDAPGHRGGPARTEG
jgi:hypothetical protein